MPEWLEEFTENQEDEGALASRDHTRKTLLRMQIRNVLQKWYRGSTAPFTHFPKDRNCGVCMRTKITRAPCRKRTGDAVARAEKKKLGDLITADHKILSEGCESRNNHRYAVVVQDLATQWIQSCPCKTQTSQEFAKVSRAVGKAESHSDRQIFGIWQILCRIIMESTSTHYRLETNGTAERAVRRIKEGTSAELCDQAWMRKWCADSMECYCHLRNVQDFLEEKGKLRMKGDLENHSKGQ